MIQVSVIQCNEHTVMNMGVRMLKTVDHWKSELTPIPNNQVTQQAAALVESLLTLKLTDNERETVQKLLRQVEGTNSFKPPVQAVEMGMPKTHNVNDRRQLDSPMSHRYLPQEVILDDDSETKV
jgi:hypothetical protein